MYEQTSIAAARLIQQELAQKTDTTSALNRDIRIIGGADISLNRFSTTIYAGIVLIDYKTLNPIACSLVKAETNFPYVPGFLAFREVPALIDCLNQCSIRPDVIMLDGHGIAHPRKMGVATHFGLLTDMPTLGCAKKKLYGSFEDPPNEKGMYSILKSKDTNLGFVLRTKAKVAPVFISPGNKMTLEDSLHIATHCMGRYRIPEPTRLAHHFVNLFRTGQIRPGFTLLDDSNRINGADTN